jgi:hypothetical protein
MDWNAIVMYRHAIAMRCYAMPSIASILYIPQKHCQWIACNSNVSLRNPNVSALLRMFRRTLTMDDLTMEMIRHTLFQAMEKFPLAQ